MTAQADCLFCKIVRKEIEASVVFEDDEALAFQDIHPQAPTHLLVIPKKHVSSLSQWDKSGATKQLLGHLLSVTAELASERGLNEGYRTVINNGERAGQTVHHLHIHLLGGRSMKWPPG